MDTKLNWHKDADFTSQLKQYQGLTEQQLVAEKQKLENEKEELATIIENQTKISRTLQNTKKMREMSCAKKN